ncbi:MAG: homogentisate phytyltransferase [Oscillatoriales cyanobacterium C42_A2020_001]|nr:homogentisate phytyltransferase [Leptolyngbyaceae cyanobacterium C42_A2020_001]
MSQVSTSPSARQTLSPQLHLTKQPILWLRAFWKFARPHTIIGTSLSVLGVFVLAFSGNGEWGMGNGEWGMENHLLFVPMLASVLFTLLACLCGNVYIVGLNQLEDVAIDRINKPHLPLASGEFSRQQGIRIVGVMGVLAIALAWSQGPYLLAMVVTSLLIGTGYSLPPIRLKRFPFWASLCIFSVRGVVVNLGLFLHFNQGLPIPLRVWALTLFILVFTGAIALFKDIPDTEGDRQYNITTFTLKLGQQAVFSLTRWILTACYLGIILAVILGLPGVNAPLLFATHLVAMTVFWIRSFRVDLKDKIAISRFYQFIWKLFFLEYLLFPALCLPWLNTTM